MSEHDNDGFYWVPEAADALRQGDLLLNVPIGLMPEDPRFVLGDGEEVQTVTYDGYPDAAPSGQIVVEARFAALSMVVTPTCHVWEGEKDEDVVTIVPVEPLRLIVEDAARARAMLNGKQVPLHHFVLPPTELGPELPFAAVALLDRPASLLKHNVLPYRRLGLYVDARVGLRVALAKFWARGDASDSITRSVEGRLKAGGALEDLE